MSGLLTDSFFRPTIAAVKRRNAISEWFVGRRRCLVGGGEAILKRGNRMSRLVLVCCVVGLLAVCGCKKSADSSKDGGGSQARKDAPPPSASPTQVIEDYLAETYKGSSPKLVSIIREEKTTFKGKPALAVAAKCSIDGNEESKIFIIQDGRVERRSEFDASKPFEDVLKEVLKD
jgi:hypothetical protein